jgi:hypothetical protein
MAVAFRAASALANEASGLTLTPVLPAGTALNDIVVAHIYLSSSTPVVSAPAGWTRVSRHVRNASNASEVWWKRAGSSETNPQFAIDVVSGGFMIVLTGWQGVVTTGDPWNIPPTLTSTAAQQTTWVAADITTTAANAMVVAFFGTPQVTNLDATTGSAAYEGASYATAAGADKSVAASYAVKATAGVVTGHSVTLTASAPQFCVLGMGALTPAVTNNPPVAKAGADLVTVPGVAVSLDARESSDFEDAPAGDSAGTLLTYAWTVTDSGGTSLTTGSLTGANTATPSFTAPSPSVTSVVTLQVQVTDSGALSSTDTVTVTVDVVREPPYADAGDSQAKLVNATVTLDASNSSDLVDTAGLPDTGVTPVLAYQWTQIAGTAVTLSPAGGGARSVTFTAPAAAEAMEFQVTVTNTAGLSAVDTTKVLVATASAQDQFTAAPVESDGHAKTLTTIFQAHLMAWEDKAAAGPVGVRTATFTDTSGQPGPCAVYGTLVLRSAVGVVNTPPVADAGVDQTAYEFATVTLNGGASSDAETPTAELIFAWIVADAGGTSLTTGGLVAANAAVCSFTAPDVSSPATITLQLQVTDAGGLSDTDTVAVTVNPAPVAEWPGGATLPVFVELRLAGVWTDITDYVDADAGITITRGRSDWAGQVDAAECHLTLFNDDGRFSIRNPFSPYYGQLTRNTQLRVRLVRTNTYHRFWGEVPSWPLEWDATGTRVVAPITATGILRRLSQSVPAVRSVLRRQIPRVLTNLVGYWPCEDQPGRNRLASGLSDGEPMRRHSTANANLASYDGFAASAPILTLNDSDWRGEVAHYTFPSGGAECQLGFLLHVGGNGSTAGQTLIHLEMTGTAQQWEIRYEAPEAANGALQVRCKTEDGVEILNSGNLHTAMNGDDCHMQLRLTKASTLIRWELYKLQPGQDDGVEFQGALSGNYSLGRVDEVVVNSGGGHQDVAVGHITVQSARQSFNRISGPLRAYTGEKAGIRIQRLCSEHNLPFASIGDLNDTERMGPQRVGALLELVRDAADADAGMIYEARNMFALGYRTRESLYNQPAEATFDYTAKVLSAPLTPVEDDQDLRNDVTATGPQGEARAVLTTGALSTQDPPNGVGVYEDQIDCNCEAGRFADHAAWRLRLGTVDEARYPLISVRLANPAIAGDPSLTAAVLGLNVGDRIAVTNLPDWLPPEPVSVLVQGYTETMSKFQHDITWNCAPESPYQVGVWDTSRYDSAGSTLSAQVAVGAASMSVATSSGPLWTTIAGDFPLTVKVAGIRVTVTNIAGVSSPQTFTVTGVTKILPSGSKVELADPAYRAL